MKPKPESILLDRTMKQQALERWENEGGEIPGVISIASMDQCCTPQNAMRFRVDVEKLRSEKN